MKLFHSLFILGVLLIFSCNEHDPIPNIQEVYSLSDGENALARHEYEFNRLKNPTTNQIPIGIAQKEFSFLSSSFNKASNSNFNWQQRGPVNVGGRTRAVALDVLNEDRILAGGVSGGLWISNNGGSSFEKVTTNLMLHSVTSIAQDTRSGFENTWYYGTGELSGNSADLVGHGIYKSIDNGLTWNLLASTSNDSANLVSSEGDFSYVSDVKVNPTNGHLIAASFAGIFLSQDGGDTWTNELVADDSPNGFGYVNFGNQTSVIVSVHGLYYATLSRDCQDNGIWRSQDGLNWIEITPTGFSNAYRRIEAAINPKDQEVLFLVDATSNPSIDNHQLWSYTFEETANGITNEAWEDRSANLPDGDCLGFYTFNFGYYQSQNSYNMLINFHPTEEDVVFIGGTNLYRNEDAFTSSNHTWIGGYQCDSLMPSNYVWPNHHPDNHVLVFLPSDPKVMFSATDGGLHKTNDCFSNAITWTSLNNGYGTSQFYTVAIEQGETDHPMILGGLQDNGTWHTNSLNPNDPWFSTFYGDGAYCAIAEDRSSYYVSWQGGKTFRFDIDDNGTVNDLTRIDPIGGADYLFINPFLLDPNNSNTMYLCGGSYIWRNDSLNAITLINNEYDAISQGWERLDESNTGGSFNSANVISAVEMSKNNSDVLYYGTFNGQVNKLSGLNSGLVVKEDIRQNNLPNGAYVSCIETNPSNEDEILLTYSNYEVNSIFHSINGGLSWTNVSGSLEENPDGSGAGPSINWAHIYQDEADSLYFVGTTSGLFSTTSLDAESTIWEREAIAEIGNMPVSMITSRTFDKNIVVATHGAGIFSTKIVEVGITEVSNTNNLNIGFPYPNPVKDKLSIDFQLQTQTELEFIVLDVLGTVKERTTKKEYPTGAQKIKLNFSNYEDGIYFILIMDGIRVTTKKVVVSH